MAPEIIYGAGVNGRYGTAVASPGSPEKTKVY
jgi:hypothetical protein